MTSFVTSSHSDEVGKDQIDEEEMEVDTEASNTAAKADKEEDKVEEKSCVTEPSPSHASETSNESSQGNKDESSPPKDVTTDGDTKDESAAAVAKGTDITSDSDSTEKVESFTGKEDTEKLEDKEETRASVDSTKEEKDTVKEQEGKKRRDKEMDKDDEVGSPGEKKARIDDEVGSPGEKKARIDDETETEAIETVEEKMVVETESPSVSDDNKDDVDSNSKDNEDKNAKCDKITNKVIKKEAVEEESMEIDEPSEAVVPKVDIKKETSLKEKDSDSKDNSKEDEEMKTDEADVKVENTKILVKEEVLKNGLEEGDDKKNDEKEAAVSEDLSQKESIVKDDVKDVKLVNGIKEPEVVYKVNFDAEKFISTQISKMELEQSNIKKFSDMNGQLKSVERKQREITKIFSDCSNLLDQFRATLEASDRMLPEKKYGDNVETVEISDDDEVEFIEMSFDPDLVANRTSQQSATTPSGTSTCMDSLRAALAEALNKQMPAQNQVNASLHRPFSDEDRKMFDLNVGSKILAKKFNDIWYKGIIQDLNNKDRSKRFKIKFDGKGTKFLDAKNVAFYENWNVPIKVGSRVVAMYRDEEATPSTSFYAGIVAEVPTNRNRHRFLIFFDDGYAQYCLPKEIHRVNEQSENVWEDIHPDSQEFIKEYLAQYPERPMVQLQKNQVVKTEWMGGWWTAKVMEVDASLVKMYFAADKRTEWIYRGSTRLEPLFSALARAETNKLTGFKNKRQRLVAASRGNKPVVEYTRVQVVELDEDDPVTSVVKGSSNHRRQSGQDSLHPTDQKKRSVAKKSTTMSSQPGTPGNNGNNNGGIGNPWEAPWLKIQRNSKATTTTPTTITVSVDRKREQFQASSISSNKQGRDMASVLQERLAAQTDGDLDEEALGERIDIDNIISPRNLLRKKVIPHECSSECVKVSDDENFQTKFRGRNLLLLPTLCGWERQVTKVRPSGKRIVIYRGPCARRMRNLEEVDKYLLATNSYLTIDLFTFDPNLHTHTEFVPIKTFCDIKDLSYGKENVPVSCVNGIDRQYPAYVEYSTRRYPAKGVHLNVDEDFLICCDCTDGCRDKTKCACIQMTIEATTASPGGHADESVGYHYRRLNEPILTGIYECSSRCKCDYRCFNKVAQNGLQLRLQVFKTEKRGWGLRCLDDIPTGGFICIYAGQLLTEQGANEDGQQYGDEYLAELDYIEVVEKHKEGYESEVVDADDDDSSSGSSLSSDRSSTSNSSNRKADPEYRVKRKRTSCIPASADPSSQNSTRDRSGKKITDNGSEEKLGKLVLKREANKDKEWSVKIQGTSQRTADWVDSLNNDPIIIDDDDDEDSQTNRSVSSAHDSKKDNIFSILNEKKEVTPKAPPKEVRLKEELPDLEEKPRVIEVSESLSADNSDGLVKDEKEESSQGVVPKSEPVSAENSDGLVKEEKEEPPVKNPTPIYRKCTRSTTMSRFKNLPNPKDGKKLGKEKLEEREQRPSTRYYFNDGQLCYVMDAKSMGNLGRFLNHSCSPNVFVQNVFVDTHDLRFPWVAFFAGQYIRAGTELTWDYNYEVGSVPGKILYCYCSSAECRGRLL